MKNYKIVGFLCYSVLYEFTCVIILYIRYSSLLRKDLVENEIWDAVIILVKCLTEKFYLGVTESTIGPVV